MNALWGHSVGVLIVMMLLSFIGIWVWAWLPYHKRNFENLAALPLNDEGERAAIEGDVR